MDGLASADVRAPDVASVRGVCCDEHGGACLASGWRIVEADKTPGCDAAAGPPRTRASSSFSHPTPGLPLRARGTTLRSLPFLLSLPPVAAFRDASTTQCRLSPSTGRNRLPEPSELAGAREGAGAGVMEVPESVVGLEDYSKVKVSSMWLDLMTWTVVWVDACHLARTCLCWEKMAMAWPQVGQRMGFQSSVASWSEPKRTPSRRLQWRPQLSSPFVCQVVRSTRHPV